MEPVISLRCSLQPALEPVTNQTKGSIRFNAVVIHPLKNHSRSVGLSVSICMFERITFWMRNINYII